MSAIDPTAVDATFRNCLFGDGDDRQNIIEADGVLNRFGFHPERLESARGQVREWLHALPTEFQEGKGGGWSFMNGCMLATGELWTGDQATVEQLFALGCALGLASRSPRFMDHLCPGGVPYFTVKQ